MSQHLSDKQINDYVSHKLAPTELLQFDDHLVTCNLCMQKAAAFKGHVIARIQGSLFAESANDHLSYELISMFVDGALDQSDRDIVERHREACSSCGEEIRDLQILKEELAAEPVSLLQTKPAPESNWFSRIFANPFLRIAVPAAAALILAALFWTIGRNSNPEVTQVTEPPASTATDVDEMQSKQPRQNVEEPTAPKIVASLIDGGNWIELDEQGKISGLPVPQFQQKVAASLRDQAIDIPPDIRQLRSAGGVLMGNPGNGLPFKLKGPLGKVVESQRPTLSWQPLKNADSYKVGIYDANFNQVAVSPQLNVTTWKPNVSLKRGVVYQWQVTAIRDGEEVRSPTRPAPEAKFKVLDSAHLQAIEKARRSARNSHLLMGIVYANAGLLDEAEREFQILLRNNPNSEIVRKLLAKLRANR